MAQSVHSTLPVAFLYCPAGHVEQTPPFAPVYPASHVQAPTDVLALGELELSGQVVQTCDPLALL